MVNAELGTKWREEKKIVRVTVDKAKTFLSELSLLDIINLVIFLHTDLD